KKTGAKWIFLNWTERIRPPHKIIPRPNQTTRIFFPRSNHPYVTHYPHQNNFLSFSLLICPQQQTTEEEEEDIRYRYPNTGAEEKVSLLWRKRRRIPRRLALGDLAVLVLE